MQFGNRRRNPYLYERKQSVEEDQIVGLSFNYSAKRGNFEKKSLNEKVDYVSRVEMIVILVEWK